MSNIRLSSRILFGLAALALMVGCGGSAAAPAISVTISTTPVAMVAGATQTFTASVANDSASAGVNWTASVGSITASGVYTAPTPVATATATITATSKTDTSKIATVTVTLTPVSVAITTTPVAMVAGAMQSFADTITGDTTLNAGVNWTASVGSITASGVYTAPTPVATATATITATSKTDTSKIATVTVTLTPIVVTIPTTPTAIAGAGTEAITATLTGDTTLNAGVTWSINAGGGTLTSVTTTSVTYNAPLPVTTATAVITATSKTDTTKSTTITIPLTPISVGAVTPASISLGVGSIQNFTGAAVSNDSSNSGVTWSISPATGAGSIVSTTGVYTAPTIVISTATTVTVTATSVKDTSKSATATITLQPITIAAVTPASVSLNGGGTQTFTGAALTYDGTNSGVTWSISPATGEGTINSFTGAYSAPAVISGTLPVTVTVTATSAKDTTKTATATITLNPIAIAFTTTTSGVTLDSGQTLALATSVTNDGSSSGATFAATGAGSVSPSSAAGNTPSTTLTATGTVASTVSVTATSVKDIAKSATTASITVNPALAITTAAGALNAGTTGTVYAGATIVSTGGSGAKTYAIATGAIPSGLSINNAGTISGIVTSTAGTYTFTVRVTDAATTPVTVTSGTYTILINPAPLVWTAPTGGTLTYTVGTAISPINLTTTGGTGTITYTVNSGTLPTGLSIVGNQVVGTPTQPTIVAGNAVTFKATDSATVPVTANSASETLIANPVTLLITSSGLPTGTVNVPYNGTGYQLTSTGGTGTITWSMSTNPIDGLTLSPTGLLSGIPTGTNSTSVTITATDSATNQQQTKSINPTLSVVNTLTITTLQSTLPYAAAGSAYSTILAAAGGTAPYTWSVTSGATGTNSLATLNLSVSSGGTISGTPSSSGTANFTVKVADSTTPTANTYSQSYTITGYAALALPAANPASLGSASNGGSYSGSVTATGGSGSYTWSINGGSYGTGSTSLGNGTVQASVSGATLNITGTPSTAGIIPFTASVKDTTTGVTVSAVTYTISVSSAYTVSGQINFMKTSGCAWTTAFPATGATITLSQGGTTVQTTTANNTTGAYSFSGVTAGTYTLTATGPGATVVFYPSTQSISVTSSNYSGVNFNADYVYNVQGTITNSSSQTPSQAHPIYLLLSPTSCAGNGTQGTTVTSAGSYTIRGVSPDTYTLQAFLDVPGTGIINANDPVGSSSVTVSAANASGANVTINDPSTFNLNSLTFGITGGGGFANGVSLLYAPITNSSSIEKPISYTVQWSSTSSPFNVIGSKTFPAVGTSVDAWFLNTTSEPTLVNGQSYYFRAYASAGSSTSSNSNIYGPVTLAAPTGGNAVSGAITLPSASTNPLYVSFVNLSTGAMYGEYFASPSATQSYAISVPTYASYRFVAILDQNNDGVIDAGDLQNTTNNNISTSISGATTNENLTLASSNTLSGVATTVTSLPSGSLNYTLNFYIYELAKQPVAVTLTTSGNTDGVNVPVSMDIAPCVTGITNCGAQGYRFNVYLGSVAPAVGDSYTFNVTYSDGTTGTVTATVSAVMNAFATLTSPAPSSTTSTLTPSFAWTDPSNASNYTYQFALSVQYGSTIWQIPGNSSNSNGFSSTYTSIPTWGTDPTGSGSTPSTGLTAGTTYQWQIQIIDSNGNSTQTQALFIAQ